MLRLDIYESGSGVKVRLHSHPAARDDRCDENCYEYACERTYAPERESPKERRERLAATVVRALMTRDLGHVAFSDLVADQPTLAL